MQSRNDGNARIRPEAPAQQQAGDGLTAFGATVVASPSPQILRGNCGLLLPLLGLYAVTTMEPLRNLRLSPLSLLWHPWSSRTPARNHAGRSCSELGAPGPSGRSPF